MSTSPKPPSSLGTSGALAADAVGSVVFRRPGSQRVFRKDGFGSAAALIGPIGPGDEIAGITNGQFSLVDILQHVLGATGPADVVVATWTMGVYDAEKAYAFVNNKLIRRIRFILDPSMFVRRPELASVLVKGFGAASFRAVNSHAKFATVRGERLAVAIRSSMNLNENRRLESFDLSADPALCAFYENLADEVWRRIDVDNRSQSESLFESLLDVESVKSPKRANPFSFVGQD
jgi:hypothetical protein